MILLHVLFCLFHITYIRRQTTHSNDNIGLCSVVFWMNTECFCFVIVIHESIVN